MAGESWGSLHGGHSGGMARAEVGVGQGGPWALCAGSTLVGELKLKQGQAGVSRVLRAGVAWLGLSDSAPVHTRVEQE